MEALQHPLSHVHGPQPTTPTRDRYTLYDPPGGTGFSSNGGTGSSSAPHHPFAHTTSTPLTPSSHYCSLHLPAVLAQLSTSSSTGLQSAKVPAIRELSGPNEFEVAAKDPMWKRFAGQFKEPLIMLLLGSAVVSMIVGNYDDAASIIAAVLIVVTGEFKSTFSAPTFALIPSDSRLRARATVRKIAGSPQQTSTALLPSHSVRAAARSMFPVLTHPS